MKCGHSAFSPYKLVNDAVGFVRSSFSCIGLIRFNLIFPIDYSYVALDAIFQLEVSPALVYGRLYLKVLLLNQDLASSPSY
jgi:hypothetical protein